MDIVKIAGFCVVKKGLYLICYSTHEIKNK